MSKHSSNKGKKRRPAFRTPRKFIALKVKAIKKCKAKNQPSRPKK